jgi:hypothetical protein
MKNAVFWDVTPCRSCVSVPPELRLSQDIHGATSQRTVFLLSDSFLCVIYEIIQAVNNIFKNIHEE